MSLQTIELVNTKMREQETLDNSLLNFTESWNPRNNLANIAISGGCVYIEIYTAVAQVVDKYLYERINDFETLAIEFEIIGKDINDENISSLYYKAANEIFDISEKINAF